mmetsp:Transcript_16624/g.39467  ORF Transcript_16624/g.39467 Transcript_16624/m.39467 type:complete len:576 (-) Transcript_16624:2561-4288(-)
MSEDFLVQKRSWLKKLGDPNTCDAVGTWDKYIHWLRSSKVSSAEYKAALQSCVESLPVLSHTKDPRYLRLWIKYASCLSLDEQLGVLEHLEANSVGSDHALFYIAYATLLERMKDYNAALAVYETGLKRNAEPQSKIQSNFEKFQSRMVSRGQRNREIPMRTLKRKQGTPSKLYADRDPGTSTDYQLQSNHEISFSNADYGTEAMHEKPDIALASHSKSAHYELSLDDDGTTMLSFEEKRAKAWLNRFRMQTRPSAGSLADNRAALISPPEKASYFLDRDLNTIAEHQECQYRECGSFVPRNSGASSNEKKIESNPGDQSGRIANHKNTWPQVSPLYSCMHQPAKTDSPSSLPSSSAYKRAPLREVRNLEGALEHCNAAEMRNDPTYTFATKEALGAINEMFQEDLPCVNLKDSFEHPISFPNRSSAGMDTQKEIGMSLMGVHSNLEKHESGDTGLKLHTDGGKCNQLVLDPFNWKLREAILQGLNPPIHKWQSVICVSNDDSEEALEVLRGKNFSDEFFDLGKQAICVKRPLGAGQYAKCFEVLDAQNVDTCSVLALQSGKHLTQKQKPGMQQT